MFPMRIRYPLRDDRYITVHEYCRRSTISTFLIQTQRNHETESGTNREGVGNLVPGF